MGAKEEKKLRSVEAVVISDMHLGTYGCKAKQLLSYLKSIQTNTLVLNGDIVDIWQFSKSYFPKSHIKVIRQILKMLEKGTQVYYVTGNHDEVLRRFSDMSLGRFSIVNKLMLIMDGKKSWIFHGDVFDVVMHHSKWLAKLGANGYGILTLINRFVNFLLSIFGQRRISLSRDIKKAVKGKGKGKLTSRFERIVADLAIKKGYHYAICGHIHWPEKKVITMDHGSVEYLNSGDWVENLTALEYYNNDWHLLHHGLKLDSEDQDEEKLEENLDLFIPSNKKLFKSMFRDVVSDN
jgi:UDP-2,3-diacylglucosamine pyrophosphatase LpxH